MRAGSSPAKSKKVVSGIEPLVSDLQSKVLPLYYTTKIKFLKRRRSLIGEASACHAVDCEFKSRRFRFVLVGITQLV